MSNNEVCRECEHFSVEDTVLCRDCAENGFVDLMNTNAQARMETYTGSTITLQWQRLTSLPLIFSSVGLTTMPRKQVS